MLYWWKRNISENIKGIKVREGTLNGIQIQIQTQLNMKMKIISIQIFTNESSTQEINVTPILLLLLLPSNCSFFLVFTIRLEYSWISIIYSVWFEGFQIMNG